MREKNTFIRKGNIALLVVEDSRGTPFKFLIDFEDVEIVSPYRWSLKKAHTEGKFYAKTEINGKYVSLHQLVTGQKWGQIDHIDRDTLDNRKENLRESDKSSNNANGLSKYRKYPRGVFLTPKGNFQSRIILNGVRHHLGTFETWEEAHEAYKRKHVELFKTHSIFNGENKL